MPGHGRPILGLEDVGGRSGRMVLPLAFTSRLQTNTLRQVFTSLRPLVVHTRQRTLSTHARRLHNQNVSIILHQPQQDGGEVNTTHQHQSISRGGEMESSRTVVIDIESTSNPEQFTSTHTVEDVRGLGAAAFSTSSSISPSSSLTQNNNVTSHHTSMYDPNSNSTQSISTSNHTSDISDVSAEEDQSSSRTSNESVSELLNQFPEVRGFLVLAWQYLIFLLIILVKVFFDHILGLVAVVGLGVGFMWANNVMQDAAPFHIRCSARAIIALIVNIPATLFLFYFTYRSDKLFYTVLLLPPEGDVLSVGELLWLVLVSDYVLKLATVLVKALLSLLPQSLLHYHNRGKYYLVVETGSQLYRSLAPVQPWLCYLLEGYAGPKKVLGVLLSAAYMVCKGPDVVAKFKCFQGSVIKFLNNMNFGHTPNKAQLEATGGMCPICHDIYQKPTMLGCNHIFCEVCVGQWFDRERTCPLCRSQVVDDPAWRDGSTTHYIQLF